MFCTKCGTQIPDEAAFCPNCGAPAGQKTSQVTPEPMAPKKNNQKMLIIGVCCAVVVVAAAIFGIVRLFGASSKGVSADQDTDVVTEANARTEEAYIERLEAYQVYYDSVKDEDEDYEVLAAISLDADKLPVLWLAVAEKDELEIAFDGDISNFSGYIKVYGYEKGEVTLLAESSKYSLSYPVIGLSNQGLVFLAYDGEDTCCYTYNEENVKFSKYSSVFDAYYDFNMNISTCIRNTDTETMTYIGYMKIKNKEILSEDIESLKNAEYNEEYILEELEEDLDEVSDVEDFLDLVYTYDFDIENYFEFLWWDGSEATYEELEEIMMSLCDGTDADVEGSESLAGFLESADFDILIRDLKNHPIYDMNTLAIKYEAIYDGNLDSVDYTVEYLDLDSLNELITEAKVDSILAAIKETEVPDDYGYDVNVDLDTIVGYQILDWNDDGNPEVFINVSDKAYSEDLIVGMDADGYMQCYTCTASLVSYDKENCVILAEALMDNTGQCIYAFDDNGLEIKHDIVYLSEGTISYIDDIEFSMNGAEEFSLDEKAFAIFNSYLAEYTLTEFSWSSPENLEEDLRNFYQTNTANGNAKVKEYVPTEAEQEVIDAKNAYAEYIQSEFGDNEILEYATYAVVNIDDDAIPEIIMDGGNIAVGTGVLVYYNGNVEYSLFPSGSYQYLPRENRVCYSCERIDIYGDTIFHIEKGELVIDDSGDYSMLYDDYGNEQPCLYSWNGVDVTDEEYNDLLGDAFDFDSATAVNAYWSYEDIMDYLQ